MHYELCIISYLCSRKNYKQMKKIALFAMAALLTACSIIEKDDNQATTVAEEWAEAYFNCDFHGAEALSTPESRRWLQFAASNTTQQDLDLLKQHAAEVEATDYFPDANDTLRVVELQVSHYLSPTLQEAKQEEEGLFHITVVKRKGEWKVRMEGLPRSEKQSRD